MGAESEYTLESELDKEGVVGGLLAFGVWFLVEISRLKGEDKSKCVRQSLPNIFEDGYFL